MNINKLIKNTIKDFLFEINYNYHISKQPINDLHPYGSENIVYGLHDTGQFGSGFYFSTFKFGSNGNGNDLGYDEYPESISNKEDSFTNIKDNLYRVNFDIYKNLYKCYSVSQGKVLHTMLYNLNVFYNRVTGNWHGEYDDKRKEADIRVLYQIIANNAESLGLKCPSPMNLKKLAESHKGGKQTFGTFFMEKNGYNGVDVSGIPELDNTTHGSVIYNLSNTGIKRVETSTLKKNFFNGSENINGQNSSYVVNGENRYVSKAIIDSYDGRISEIYILHKLDEKAQMVWIKNILRTYAKIDEYLLDTCIESNLKKATKFILNIIYNNPSSEFDKLLCNSKICKFIVNNDLLKFKKYKFSNKEYYESFLDYIKDSIYNYTDTNKYAHLFDKYNRNIPDDVFEEFCNEEDKIKESMFKKWELGNENNR